MDGLSVNFFIDFIVRMIKIVVKLFGMLRFMMGIRLVLEIVELVVLVVVMFFGRLVLNFLGCLDSCCVVL